MLDPDRAISGEIVNYNLLAYCLKLVACFESWVDLLLAYENFERTFRS